MSGYQCFDRTCNSITPCHFCVDDGIYPHWAWVGRFPGTWDHNWRTADGSVQRWHGVDADTRRPGDFEHHDVPGLWYRTWLTSTRLDECHCRDEFVCGIESHRQAIIADARGLTVEWRP